MFDAPHGVCQRCGEPSDVPRCSTCEAELEVARERNARRRAARKADPQRYAAWLVKNREAGRRQRERERADPDALERRRARERAWYERVMADPVLRARRREQRRKWNAAYADRQRRKREHDSK